MQRERFRGGDPTKWARDVTDHAVGM